MSADFGNHPGGYFTLSTLKELKNKKFELIAYATTNRKDEFSHHFPSLFSFTPFNGYAYLHEYANASIVSS